MVALIVVVIILSIIVLTESIFLYLMRKFNNKVKTEQHLDRSWSKTELYDHIIYNHNMPVLLHGEQHLDAYHRQLHQYKFDHHGDK